VGRSPGGRSIPFGEFPPADQLISQPSLVEALQPFVQIVFHDGFGR